MSRHLERDTIAKQADIHPHLPAKQPVDRTFEMPRQVYGTAVGLYLGFIATMALCFGNPELILPMALFAFIIVAGFGVPTLWARMAPESRKSALSWGRFQGQGIDTLTGRLTAGEAMGQVLVLPVLIFLWGLAVVTIAAFV